VAENTTVSPSWIGASRGVMTLQPEGGRRDLVHESERPGRLRGQPSTTARSRRRSAHPRPRSAGQRRFATQQYDISAIKELARAGGCTLNDIVLYLCGTALRRYLLEHDELPWRSLTADVSISLRSPDDRRPGTDIGTLVAELGTDIADPYERLEAIKRSARAAKQQLRSMPQAALDKQLVAMNGPYIAGLLGGLGGHAPIPFSVAISNVPGPPEPRYFNGARMDAIFPVSVLFHGNALNITCVSYAGTLNFGILGARDTLPELQHMTSYLGEAVDELSLVLGI
jgi:diacylglycerol O-acyltransferase / wax synthase